MGGETRRGIGIDVADVARIVVRACGRVIVAHIGLVEPPGLQAFADLLGRVAKVDAEMVDQPQRAAGIDLREPRHLRSEERRSGKECVSTGRSWWCRSH